MAATRVMAFASPMPFTLINSLIFNFPSSGRLSLPSFKTSRARSSADRKHEVFAVLFLNRANKINHFEVISRGGITGTIADPRIILKKALEEDAVSLILCHNHPSGSLRPSRSDEDLTRKIKEAASYFDIKVLDHLIVSEDGYYSFADEGLL